MKELESEQTVKQNRLMSGELLSNDRRAVGFGSSQLIALRLGGWVTGVCVGGGGGGFKRWGDRVGA